MSKSIKIVLNHDLGAAEAQRRIQTGLESLRKKFADKIGSASAEWNGGTALIRVAALGQSAEATVEVLDRVVNIELQLPWLLAAFAEKVRGYVQASGEDALRLAPPR